VPYVLHLLLSTLFPIQTKKLAGGCGKNQFLEKYQFEDSEQTGSKVQHCCTYCTVYKYVIHMCKRMHCLWKLRGHTVTKWYIPLKINFKPIYGIGSHGERSRVFGVMPLTVLSLSFGNASCAHLPWFPNWLAIGNASKTVMASRGCSMLYIALLLSHRTV
jgi:hypothetical protein